MDTLRKKVFYIIMWLLLFIFAIGMVASVMVYFSESHNGYEVYNMCDGWNVNYCGHRFTDISRRDGRLKDIKVKRNDIVSMEKKIDINDARMRLTLRLYSRMSSVRVSIIDRGAENVIFYYGYNDDGINPGDFLGSGYHFIQLPQHCDGKTLRIMEMSSEDGAIRELPDIIITESDHAMENFAQERLTGTFITIFMIIAGCAVAILSVFMATSDNKFYNLTLTGLFSAISGLWCMCAMKTIELFVPDIRAGSITEYISLYMIAIPLMWLAIRFFRKAMPVVRVICLVSVVINTVLVIIAVILQYEDIANIDAMVKIFHAIIAFDAILLTIVSLIRWRKSDLSERFFEGGIFFAAGMSVVYIIYYNFHDMTDAPGAFDVVIMPCALLFMTIMLLLGYISDLYTRRIDDAQREKLMSLAFTDEMTGLDNRAMGEQRLSEMDSSDGKYLLINMDLNFLKKVNDIAGHAAGDKYICTFASILKEVFPDALSISRMGGDEFLVIYSVNLPDRDELENRISRMKKMESEKSGFMPDNIEIDAAYGYAYSDEEDDAYSTSIYQLADKRMYEMKVSSKKGRMD